MITKRTRKQLHRMLDYCLYTTDMFEKPNNLLFQFYPNGANEIGVYVSSIRTDGDGEIKCELHANNERVDELNLDEMELALLSETVGVRNWIKEMN